MTFKASVSRWIIAQNLNRRPQVKMTAKSWRSGADKHPLEVNDPFVMKENTEQDESLSL
jgi:hypothetical protein